LKHNNEKKIFRKDLKTIQQEKTEEEKEMVRSEKSVLLVYVFFAISATCKGILCFLGYETSNREEVFMEGPLEPNMGPSLADVLLCTFGSTNAGFSSFPFRKLLSWE
jgi:hypothetical protein